MSTIDPDQIPPTPVYTITLSSSGTATVDGEEITSGGDADAARLAALAEVRIKAALHGRPVRAVAKDQDGSAWPLIVAVDGTVTTLDHPHPTPTPPPAPVPAQATPAPPTSPPAPTVQRAQQAAVNRPPTAAEPRPDMSPEWAAVLPAEYSGIWGELRAYEKAGRLAEAIITADRIETALTEQYGPLHPYTVNVLTVRAAFTARQAPQSGEWAEVTELLLDTAERRREAKAQPETDNARVIRNAHAAWRYLRAEDAETALELSERLLGLLDGDELRARDVVQWVESGAARHGAA
ncbi:hypothetical protein [Streptomyces varsoviensis]|uniref:hypothetical protein n=1 Tax=Streptomyces varsoviensis TaxID=67373 RepID=UPI0006622F20|nr:hypothetical protein [Streptomyces varsoviensis]